MAHIAIDARIINSSTGRYIERLLTYLEKLDSPHRFSVLVRAKDKDFWKPTKDNFKVVVADYHQYTVAEQTKFHRFLKRLDADLIHFCMPQQPLLYTGKSVTTVHDLNLLRIKENEGMSVPILKIKQLIFAKLLRIVTKRSVFVLTPTRYTKDDLLQFQPVDTNKVIVTYEAADLVSDTEDPVKQFDGKKFLIVVGRAEKYKNQRGAIEAHQLLLKNHPDLWLVIIGKRDQTSRKLEAWTKKRGYKQIEFFGFATDAQLAWFYNHCAAYVFPSFMEGFGLPALEAMKHGAPVVSSSATCLPEVLGDAAIYFDPSQPSEMADQIARGLNDSALQKTLVSKGAAQADKYSWLRMAKETHEV
ncbi:glycosyltransferase family 4 protein, partial [Candidatus Saccharibacteria bacterium]|nr:glycosyltransferase family 4 protein [Candidatus Saccharibacteria bacterium]